MLRSKILFLAALVFPLIVGTACVRQGRVLQNNQAADTPAIAGTAIPASTDTAVSTQSAPTEAAATSTPVVIPTAAQSNDSVEVQELLSSLDSLVQSNESDDNLDNLP